LGSSQKPVINVERLKSVHVLSIDYCPLFHLWESFHLWEFHNDWNQRFIIKECHDDEGYYNIIIDNGLQLLVSLSSPNEGCELILLSNTNNDLQKFQFIETEHGYVIFCKLNHLVFDVENGNMDNGSRVIAWKSNDCSNQLW